MNLGDFLLHSDVVSRLLALLLLALSVGSWVVIVWKWRLLNRVGLDVRRSVAAFWQSPGFDDARQRVAQFDRDACVTPMIDATLLPVGGTLACAGDRQNQLTRVWGIFNALTGMAEAGQLTIDKVAGPVGEALIMTAAGLAVAIPAVLGYNLLGRRVALIEAELEGFAHDLRGLLTGSQD